MKKRMLCCLCALALILLPGCTLARGRLEQPMPTRLMGAFVTYEWIGSGEKVEGVLDGSDPLRPVITFEGVEGIPIFCYPVEEEGQSVRYVTSGDARLSEERTGVHVGGGITYEAALTALANRGSLYWHRLYRRADGSVYLITETGTGFGEGTGSIFYEEEDPGPASAWNDGPWLGEYTFHVKTHLPIERYVLCHMTADNRELKRESYLPGQLPEALTVAGDWLLVEAHLTGEAGPVVERQTVGHGEGVLTTLELEESGVFRQVKSTLSW